MSKNIIKNLILMLLVTASLPLVARADWNCTVRVNSGLSTETPLTVATSSPGNKENFASFQSISLGSDIVGDFNVNFQLESVGDETGVNKVPGINMYVNVAFKDTALSGNPQPIKRYLSQAATSINDQKIVRLTTFQEAPNNWPYYVQATCNK